MDRVLALIQRLEDEKNEELFGVCTSQIVQLYGQKPEELSHLLFYTIRDFMLSKKTYKRLLAAALFEKMMDEIAERQDNLLQFAIDKSRTDFSARHFVQEMEKDQKRRGSKRLSEYEELVNMDILGITREEVRVFVSRRENFLYSKSEQKLKEKEKSVKKKFAEDEKRFLNRIDEDLLENDDIDMFQKRNKEEVDFTEGLKRIKTTEELHHNEKQQKKEDLTTIFDCIYELALYLVFHQNWEIRHSALLIFRSIVRKINKIFSVNNLPEGFDLSAGLHWSELRRIDNYSTALNEQVKQKCILLLSLDRFSDFMSDKSNMTNRALAAEILVLSFSNVQNFSVYFFINEILFAQSIKSGWEPKQAFIFLMKNLIDYSFMEDPKTHQMVKTRELLIQDSEFAILFKQIEKVIEEHEEITEVSCELMLSIMQKVPSIINEGYTKRLQAKVINCLEKAEDISYLPKPAFELLLYLLNVNLLNREIEDRLPGLIRKFLFHNNEEVRRVMFSFIQTYFGKLTDKASVISEDQLVFFFRSILLYHCIEAKKEDRHVISSVLANILDSVRTESNKSVICDLFIKLLDYLKLDEVINSLNDNFLNQTDSIKEIDWLYVPELIILILQKQKDNVKTIEILKASENTMIKVILMLFDYKDQNTDGLLEKLKSSNYTDIKISYLDKSTESTIKGIEDFITNNIDELPKEESIAEPFYKLLCLFKDKAQGSSKLTELYNLFVLLSNGLKSCFASATLSSKMKKLAMEIANNFLPSLDFLRGRYERMLTFYRLILSYTVISSYNEKKELLPKTSINAIVKPFLDFMAESIDEFWQKLTAEALTRMDSIYGTQAKHPMAKIVESLIRKRENENMQTNSWFFFANLAEKYKIAAFERFPAFEEMIKNTDLLRIYHKIFLKHSDFDTRKILQNKVFKVLTEQSLAEDKQKLYYYYFESVKQDFCASNTNLNDFLLYLDELLRSRDEICFSILHILIKKAKLEFLPFSLIYLVDILKALNEKLGFNKQQLYEVFADILTLAYVQSKPESLLPANLKEKAIEGSKFLFELKNPQHTSLTLKCRPDVKLRQYQQDGVKFLAFMLSYGLSCALCDDMGLGKTMQTLVAVASCANEPTYKILVVVPNSLVYHWRKEVHVFLDEKVVQSHIILQNGEKTVESIEEDQGTNIYIVGYSSFIKNIEKFAGLSFDVMVLDEAHMAKNPKSQLSIAVKRIVSKSRIALTGTPIQNNISELWNIFDFLLPNYLSTKESFKADYKSLLDVQLLALDVEKMELTKKQKHLLKKLHKRVLPFIIRREKTAVLKDLPPKIIQDFDCQLTDIQSRLYEVFEQSEIAPELGKVNIDGIDAADKNIKVGFLLMLSNLRKILNHPSLLTEIKNDQLKAIVNKMVKSAKELKKDFYASGKIQGLKELLNSIGFNEDSAISCEQNPNKLLLFTRDNLTLSYLTIYFKKVFPYLAFSTLTSDQNQKERSDVVDTFNYSKHLKLLLLTPKVGGLGLNLSSANIVIMFDHDFNPMNDLQAMDRAHRIGQVKTVNVYRMVTKGTLEEQIMGIQRFKISVANTVVNIENSDLSNVKKSDVVGFLDSFVKENITDDKKEATDTQIGKYAKIIQQIGIDEEWDENEYTKEYI